MHRDMRWPAIRVIGTMLLLSPLVSAQEVRKPSTVPERAEAPASAAQAKAAAKPEPKWNDAKMKQLLQEWEKKSSLLKTLDVAIKRRDKSAAWGNEEYEGRAILKSPDLAWLDFQKVVTDEKSKERKLAPDERIICTGTEVWQYKSDTKQIFIFPLEKEDQKRALEEGPLPFLFNMKAAEAQTRYWMALTNETKEYYVVTVVPRLKIDQEAFSKAYLKLNKEYFPERIVLVSPDGKSTKDFTLTDVKRNQTWKGMDDNFKGVPLGKPWQVVRDPGGQKTPTVRQSQGVGAKPSGAPRRVR